MSLLPNRRRNTVSSPAGRPASSSNRRNGKRIHPSRCREEYLRSRWPKIPGTDPTETALTQTRMFVRQAVLRRRGSDPPGLERVPLAPELVVPAAAPAPTPAVQGSPRTARLQLVESSLNFLLAILSHKSTCGLLTSQEYKKEPRRESAWPCEKLRIEAHYLRRALLGLPEVGPFAAPLGLG